MVTVKNTAIAQREKPKGRHPDKALPASLVCSAPLGRLTDGNGLYLFVQHSGTQSEIQRLVIHGRRREFGLDNPCDWIVATPHGFMSSFQNWTAEGMNHPREVIEVALAHVVQNRVEAAYLRTNLLFEHRHILMDGWDRYLAQGTATDPEPSQ